jgi:quinol-cytochrome oxidoreductase complex cytochrome b subunit
LTNKTDKKKLRDLIKEKGVSGAIKDFVVNSQVWSSFFRHGLEDTSKTRMQTIISNVFLHLHPAKVKRHAPLFKFTWCMGGLTFFLFLVLTVTGVFLMFYYHPNTRDAYWDMKGLEYHVPFGLLLRNLHRWGAHLMVITVWFHLFRVFMTGSYKPPREFNWGIGVVLLVLTLLLSGR